MKTTYFKTTFQMLLAGSLFFLPTGCQVDDADLKTATYPTTPEVFIDGFSAGLNYAAFGSSKVTAFQADNSVGYNGSKASMRIDVPDFGDPEGAYAGGTFFTTVGRDLSGYDALTFWAKSTQSATIDVVGFGNDLGANTYQVGLNNVKVTTAWKKYIIPIPDASKLTAEKGMFYFSEGPENQKGYTFWIDEVKFEKLGTLGSPTGSILNGRDSTVTVDAEDVLTIGNYAATFNLPNGVNQTEGVSINYFTFASSNENVARVNDKGVITVQETPGQAVVTARLGNLNTVGSFIINSGGMAVKPQSVAPTPTASASNVISLYSNAYTNVPIDSWNPHWQYSTAENTFIRVLDNDVIRYKNLNFVGVVFTTNQINASNMTHLHLDIWTPDAVTAASMFKVLLADFGADAAYGGGDDTQSELTFTRPLLVSQNWVGIDIPLKNFTSLTNRNHLAQMVLSGNIPNIYVDNVYFYRANTPLIPTAAAPLPTTAAANVISIFSNSYTNVAGTDFNPNWGQSTVVSQVSIGGNTTLKFAGLNYQGTQLSSNLNVSAMQYLHLDYWTGNSNTLKVFLISPGPKEVPYTLTVPTTAWTSVDIPLTSFSGVDLTSVNQFKFEGNGDIYLDNIFFRK